MTRTVIDPITRIEGHLRAELEVEDGVVTNAWVSGGSFRGMELVVQDRTPEDAAMIVQRICGVCPVSHCHAASIAGEKAYGITISNNARIIRNIIEGAQFLHSHILWFYNLAALDFVNPLNGLKASAKDAQNLAEAAGTSTNTDFAALKKRLSKFAANGQLSIFSGNWFDADKGEAYKLPAELDLICTAHYLEALTMQAKASEISGLIGGKMPHIMTSTVGGTMWVPTEEKLDDLWALVNELRDWIHATILPDTMAIAPYYTDALKFGGNDCKYAAWGVFDRPSFEMSDRYLPSGIVDLDKLTYEEVDESKIMEYVGHSWYEGEGTLNPLEGETKPLFTDYDVNDRYTWCKAPHYDGEPLEAGPLARVLSAYLHGVKPIKEGVDSVLKGLGAPGKFSLLNSTLGRIAGRNVEAGYIADLMVEWVAELIEAVKGGDSEYFRSANQTTGDGTGFWEAPRGALYHTEHVVNGKITGYQIIIPTTWNIAPINEFGKHGPMEQAFIGCPVETLDKPINVLRTAHSFDPCTACAVHVTEPKTGRSFNTVLNPWGVK
ncbi:MAG: nickel-dependent hydrogenase large subunit [Eggerthellaceae bacterium]